MTFDKNAWQRARRKANGNSYTKKYERTKKGFLMRKYRNMQSRVRGIQSKKSHLYMGKSLLPREEFYEWALGCESFHMMFEVWESSDYDRKLCPTVDRIDSEQGYEVRNMRWMTHSENSRRGCESRYGIGEYARFTLPHC